MNPSTLIIACMCMTLGLTLAMDYGSSYGSYGSYGASSLGSYGASSLGGYGSYGYLPYPTGQSSGGLQGGFLFLILFLFLFLILFQNGIFNTTTGVTVIG